MDFMVTGSSILQVLHVSNIQCMVIHIFCYGTHRKNGVGRTRQHISCNKEYVLGMKQFYCRLLQSLL